MGPGKSPSTLCQYALDTLAMPATSTGCEKIFSSAKKLVSPERNRPGGDVIGPSECLKAWWDKWDVYSAILGFNGKAAGLSIRWSARCV